MLVHYRIALQRKVLGIIRLDALLTTSFTISFLPAAVHGVVTVFIEDVGNGFSVFILWDTISADFSFLYILILIYVVALPGFKLLIKRGTQHLISKFS